MEVSVTVLNSPDAPIVRPTFEPKLYRVEPQRKPMYGGDVASCASSKYEEPGWLSWLNAVGEP